MTRHWKLLWIALALAPSQAVAGPEPRAVVELFTSQGCSSCPPADKLLGELAKDPSLVVLSLPVDYWDYLGWKDTLALSEHSRRQRAYSQIRGDREVYTPQVVVNGNVHAIGSDRAAIEYAMGKSRHHGEVLTTPIRVSVANGTIAVTATAAKSDVAAVVWLCAVAREVSVAIGRGENTGRQVTYHNVVRRWIKLGDWKGKSETWSLPVGDLADDSVDAVAVLVQVARKAGAGPVLGAGFASLK